MAKAKKRRQTARRGSPSDRRGGTRQPDAVELLKSDHRQVEEWFEQFQSTRSQDRKQRLAGQICQALKVHTRIEEEIFYPAFLEATGDEDIHHEAEVEHEGAKRLIADIEASGSDDDYFDARVGVLSEMIRHHVNEEEKRDGMFAKARKTDMDMVELGRKLSSLKNELMSAADTETSISNRAPRAGHAQARA